MEKMEYHALSVEDRQFLSLVHHLRKHDKAGYIALLCAMACGSPTAPLTEFEGVSRGTFKRAVKCLRVVQKDYPAPAAIDRVVAYIRRERLGRGEGAA